MPDPVQGLGQFVEFVRKHIKGHERPEAQLFCDHLFRALGHEGAIEAGGTFETPIRYGKKTKFLDLVWTPHVLIEMKTRGEKLERHYQQAFNYWLYLTPQRPEYVILCNFDEFWIYDLNRQLDEPVDRVRLDDLPHRFTALNFLLPKKKKPIFHEDWVEVTEEAAGKISSIYKSLKDRGEERIKAQRFVLQCVAALFSQNINLLPEDLFTEIVDDCRKGHASTYDLFRDLFDQMNDPKPARGGRFRDVPYFNGGLFAIIDPIELAQPELELLADAAGKNWSKVKPSIFGSMFEGTMESTERHSIGGHYTSEADIQLVVLPTIVRPWRNRLAAVKSIEDLLALRQALVEFQVLDSACGSGNFLYVAYRELKRIEMDLLDKLADASGKRRIESPTTTLVSAKQFHGIDINDFAVYASIVALLPEGGTARG